MNDRFFIRPIRRFVVLVDEQYEHVEGGIVIAGQAGVMRNDFAVAAIGTEETDVGFGVGDRVVLSDPDAGRRVMLDGIVYRVARVKDIIAVIG